MSAVPEQFLSLEDYYLLKRPGSKDMNIIKAPAMP